MEALARHELYFDDRTWSLSRISPSISLNRSTTSLVRELSTASPRSRKPSPSIFPISHHSRCLTAARRAGDPSR